MKKRFLVIENEYYTPTQVKDFETKEEAICELLMMACETFEIEFNNLDEIEDYQKSDEWQEQETYTTYHFFELE